MPESAIGLVEFLNVKVRGKKAKTEAPIFFVDFYEKEYLPGLKSGEIQTPSGTKCKASTLKTKQVLLNAFKRLEAENKKIGKIRFDEVTEKLCQLIVQDCHNRDLSIAYTGKLIKELKVVLRVAYKRGYHSNRAFEDFKVPSMKKTIVVLTGDELEKIRNLDLSDRPNLINYRETFLVGCYTAQRFSDYSSYDKDNLKSDGAGGLELVFHTKKTGKLIEVPVLDEIKDYLTPEYFKRKNLIEQKMNKAVKEICRLAKIDELTEIIKSRYGVEVTIKAPKYQLITSHTARRTGATLFVEKGVPRTAVMKITGHTTEANLNKYIGYSSETAKAEIRKAFLKVV